MTGINNGMDPNKQLRNKIIRFYEDYHSNRERQPDDRMINDYWHIFHGSILEVGSGRRIPTENNTAGSSYISLDISFRAIQASRIIGILGIVADGEYIPFNKEQFDTVACCEVIEHVVDPARLISEMSRTCKGTLIIMGPNYLGTQWMPGLDRYIPFRILKFFTGIQKKVYRLEYHLVYDEKWSPDRDAVSGCNAWWIAKQLRESNFIVKVLDTWSFFNLHLFNRIPVLRYLGPYQIIVGQRRNQLEKSFNE
jgi:SAM-dependent methyltransferase